MIDRIQKRSLINFRDELKVPSSISDSMADAIKLWSLMHTNEAPWVGGDVHSLNLANGICREFSRLVTLELKSRVENNKALDELYRTKVLRRVRKIVDMACEKGAVIIKPRIDGRGDIQVDLIGADNFLPIAFDSNGNIISGIFGSFCKYGRDYYTLAERHDYDFSGTENVQISVYRSPAANRLGKRIRAAEFPPCWRGITEEMTFHNLSAPLFTYFKMPPENFIDENSPMGVSVFAGATELIRDADMQYSSLLWEYKGGEMAIYADPSALEESFEGENGEVISRMPRHTRRIIRTFDSTGAGGESFFKEFAPALRDERYIAGLERILKSIEFSCQLAYGTLSDPQSVDKTAEEIRASKQRSYAAVLDIQNALADALNDCVDVIEYYMAICENREVQEQHVIHEFDDSLACDRKQEFTERMELTSKGIDAPWEMRAWYHGEDEATAKARIREMNIDL